MKDDVYKYDKEFHLQAVLACECLMARCGLILFNSAHLCMFTKNPELDDFNTCVCRFICNENIDYSFEVSPSPSNPLLLKPSRERAVVECVLHRDKMDEGLLIEGLKTYVDQFCQPDRLYRAAEYFGLDRRELDYRLDEARNDYEVSTYETKFHILHVLTDLPPSPGEGALPVK